MKCERRYCDNEAEYIVDYVLRTDNTVTHQKKMCKDHRKATYMAFRIERIEVMNEEEKVMPVCNVCDTGKKVDDYNYERDMCKDCAKNPQCTKCGEPANITAFEDMYCTPCYNVKVGEKKKEDVLGDLVKDAQKVLGGIGEAIRENFIPKFHSPKVGEFTTDQLISDYIEKDCVVTENTKALYSRQPHYEGGIDPITFGQDNLSPEEMNGFYKMNVIKYVARCDRKNGLEDLQKARDYLNLLIASYEEKDLQEDEEVTEFWRYGEDKPFAVEKNSPFFMEKCERLKHEQIAKEYITELNKHDEVLIPRELSHEIHSMIFDYVKNNYRNFQYTDSIDGIHIEV